MLSKLLEEKDLAEYIWVLNISKEKFMKNRMSRAIFYFLLLFLISIVLIVLSKVINLTLIVNPVYLIIFSFIIAFIAYKIPYINLKSSFNKRKDEVYKAFPLWVSTLEILVMSNNIPNTFRKSIETCPECFKEDLEDFVEKIQFDPENKDVYKNFLKRYKIQELSEIVMDLYTFNKLDKSQIAAEFNNLNNRLNKISSTVRENKQKTTLFFISALNSIPILTASIYVLYMSMSLGSL